MLVTINLDEETHAITKQWPNISWQIREYIRELNAGLRPLCLKCGKPIYMLIGTQDLQCLNCLKKYQMVLKDE